MSKQTYERKPKVAFVCVHNSCRSQMAEALGKLLASDVFESYSAGTKLKKQINPDAVRLMNRYMGLIWKRHSTINCYQTFQNRT